MPCERKHIEALRHALDNKSWAEVYDALRAAEAACDESPCVWRDHAFGSRVAGCTNLAYIGTQKDSWVYCPHCGRKIAPLPAAPEVGNV